MKLLKKLFAVMFALTLVIGTGTRVNAEDGDTSEDTGATTYTITISKDSTDTADHTYGAYQIFKGDLAEKDGKKVLSNIKWGDNVNGATAVTELKRIKTISTFADLANDADAATVAKAIADANLENDSAGAQAIADAFAKALKGNPSTSTLISEGDDAGKYKITGLSAGYYLVKDTTAVTGMGAQTRYILEVVDDVTPNEKANVPSVEKKVKEKNDTTVAETGWQDAADYDIGDEIPYQLTGTLPGKFAEFDTYKVYTFIDTLSNGLTPPKAEDVTVKVGDKDVTSHFDVAVDGQVLKISLKSGEDLRTWTDPALTSASTFVVDYKATLNENAKIGSEGNLNTVKLEFTNNPNGEQDGEKGTTPEDKVIVFTYEIKALKVEPTSDAAITEAQYKELTDAEKADYVKVGDKYQKTQALSGAGFTLFKKVGSDYVKVGKEITGKTTFEFKGTDAGEYKLVETTVPSGYNKAADIIITVAATYDTEADDPKLKTLTVTPATAGFTVTTTAESDGVHITTDGVISGKILNEKGSVLPSTGGIGTTIFYVLGGLLVAGAGIVLVARKKAAE